MKKIHLFSILLMTAILCPHVRGAEANPTSKSSIALKLPPQYVLEKLKGRVLILAKDSKNPEPAEEDQTVQGGDTVLTRGDSEVSLTLNENTMFQLSANSEVKVEELTRKSPRRFISRLKLAAGAILAQVEKLKKSSSVFEIESGGVVCGVRGTAFEVQKEGDLVQTNTYEGVVEMKKDKQVEQVPADRHSAFSADKGLFLQQRTLSERERARYENWKNFRDLVIRRQAEREAALKAYDVLPPTEQTELWKKLEGFKGKDRLKALRQMLREKDVENRTQMGQKATNEKSEILKQREETARKAEEERGQRLKNPAKK